MNRRGDREGDGVGVDLAACVTLSLSHAAALLFRGLLIVGDTLHIPDEPLFFTELLETSNHLLHRLAGTTFDLKHKPNTLSSSDWIVIEQSKNAELIV